MLKLATKMLKLATILQEKQKLRRKLKIPDNRTVRYYSNSLPDNIQNTAHPATLEARWIRSYLANIPILYYNQIYDNIRLLVYVYIIMTTVVCIDNCIFSQDNYITTII